MPAPEPDWLKIAREEGRILSEYGSNIEPQSGPEEPSVHEEDFQQHILDEAERQGWLRAHFRTVRIARADGSFYYATPVAVDGEGFPDLVLVRERIIYAECKSAKGVLKPAQKLWRDRLEAAGAEYYLWKPCDWEAILDVLRRK